MTNSFTATLYLLITHTWSLNQYYINMYEIDHYSDVSLMNKDCKVKLYTC